jgi:hypothetical protein
MVPPPIYEIVLASYLCVKVSYCIYREFKRGCPPLKKTQTLSFKGEGQGEGENIF